MGLTSSSDTISVQARERDFATTQWNIFKFCKMY